ncbi:MAG: hypothetical protein Q6373_008230 [Candidatus Sigynarchaeota archaeon]
MEFNATLENSRILKGIIEAISFLIEETYVYIYPTGLKLNAIDSSHVAMLLAFIPKELFTDYKCTEDSKIGINVQDLLKILRRAKSNDEIQLKLDKKDKNTLLITMKSDKSTTTYKIKSKEIPGYDAKEEGLLESFEDTLKDKFTATIQLEGPVLDDIVKNALIISDLMKVQVMSAEKVINFTASDESGEVAIEIDLEGKGVLDKKVQNDAEGIYSLNFLENIIKIQSITNNFEIALGNNIPMKIKGAITSSAGNPTEGRIVYLLAPRVEEQNEDEFGDDFEASDVEDELGSGGDDEDSGGDDSEQ